MAGQDGVVDMEEKVMVSYDEEFDTLYLHRPGVRTQGAVEIGDFVIEFSSQLQKAVAVEILNASRVLSEVSGQEITPTFLSHIVKAGLRTVHRADAVYVLYSITWAYQQQEECLAGTITVPLRVRA